MIPTNKHLRKLASTTTELPFVVENPNEHKASGKKTNPVVSKRMMSNGFNADLILNLKEPELSMSKMPNSHGLQRSR